MKISGNKKALTKLGGIKGLLVANIRNINYEQYGTDRK